MTFFGGYWRIQSKSLCSRCPNV